MSKWAIKTLSLSKTAILMKLGLMLLDCVNTDLERRQIRGESIKNETNYISGHNCSTYIFAKLEQ
ncbi:hypothetical protein NCCP28_24680 [Niallia sp. NCCP-28]|nr:hypothetical protein NCCP28_24680 [Niallia sp. NCCP-28]